jgi:hypothetical protein
LCSFRDEWIPANSNRILARHDKKEKGGGDVSAPPPHAALQKALGLSSHDALRLPPCPFDVSNRVGVVEAVDLRSGEYTDEDGPLVLIRVVDESLSVTVMIWMKLALLRSAMPLAHQTPSHLCPVPPKPSVFNAATLHALHLSTPDLLHFAVDAQQKSIAIMAKRIVQEAVMQMTKTTHTPSDTAHAASLKLTPLPISPISPLSPMLHQPDALHSLPRLLQHMKLQDLLPLLCHPLAPSSLTSILSFSQSESISHTSSKLDTDRTRLVATVAQLILARWQMDLLGLESHTQRDMNTSEDEGSAPTALPFEDDLFQLIESCSQSLLHAATKLQLHQLAVVAPGQSITVGLDAAAVSDASQHKEDEYEDESPTTPFSLQLVSTVLDPLMSELVAPKFSRDAVWTIRFYSDAAHTVLLKEMRCTADPQSRMVPPFVVSNPVYITASHSQKSLQKLKEAKASGKSASAKSVKFSADEAHVNFSITPMTHDSLEMMSILSEAIVHIRRMQIAGSQMLMNQAAPSEAGRPKPQAFAFSTSPSSSTFIHTLVTSSSLATTLDHFLTIMYEGLKDFVEVFTRFIPVPSNPKVRAYDTIALIVATEILTKKSRRGEKGVIRKSKRAPEADEDDETHEGDFLTSMHDEELDVTWLIDAVVPEAKSRFTAERSQFPLHSVYLQRLLELLLVGVRYEFMLTSHEAVDIGDDLFGTGASSMQHRGLGGDGQLRSIVQQELPIVLTMEQLLLHATDPAAHPPPSDTGAETVECKCAWCQDLADTREESQQASAFLDLSPSSIMATLLYDLDCYPDLRDVETGLRRRNQSARSQLSRIMAESERTDSNTSSLVVTPSTPAVSLPTLAPSADPTAGSFSAILNAFNSATNLFRTESQALEQQSEERRERVRRGIEGDAAAFAAAADSSSSSSQALVPYSTSTPPGGSQSFGWRYTVSLCDRLLSSSALRTRLLHLLLNGTAAPNLPRPEIAFRRGADVEEMTSITQAKHLYRSLPHTHPTPTASAASKEKRKKALMASDEALGRGNMFQQLVDAFIKSNLYCKPISLRAELGAVTFKCILSGVLDQGAAGLPGPFRQALAEISSFLNAEALDSSSIESGSSLFIPTPNSRSQTGDDRNKLLLNPSLLQKGEISLVQCRIFGQLIGIAIRSKCCLNMDLSAVFWKQLLEIPLVEDDLQSFDYTASKSLKFIDPSNDMPFTQEEFDEYLGYLTWTTVLSDGTTQVELKPGGATQKVHFHQRYQYASKAIEARLQESALLVAAIREGLLSVIPKQVRQQHDRHISASMHDATPSLICFVRVPVGLLSVCIFCLGVSWSCACVVVRRWISPSSSVTPSTVHPRTRSRRRSFDGSGRSCLSSRKMSSVNSYNSAGPARDYRRRINTDRIACNSTSSMRHRRIHQPRHRTTMTRRW